MRFGIERWHGVLGEVDGRDACPGVGHGPRRAGWSARSCSRRRRTPRPTRWPGASRGCSPSAPILRTGAATYEYEDWPVTRMGIARRIARTTYRHEGELDERFGRSPRAGEDPLGGGGRYDVESYLDHHAAKLTPALRPQQLRGAHRGDEQP